MELTVRVRREVLQQMAAHAQQDPNRECCGLLGGRDGIITAVYPAANVSASATAYEIAPQEIFRIFRALRGARLELAGIYHSHPNGELFPSQTDIERAYYPDAAYFIASPLAEVPAVAAFSIRDGRVTPLTIEAVLT